MKTFQAGLILLAAISLGIFSGCTENPTKSPEVADQIRKSIAQAGLKDVSVRQDRDKGVVTLSGSVRADSERQQAESIARGIAGNQVVANEIAVLPAGNEKDAKAVNADLDAAIEKNLDAALIQNKLHDIVRYDVKNGVITLKGEVNSQTLRGQVEQMASTLPNVQQVVNELQVKNQKATSTGR